MSPQSSSPARDLNDFVELLERLSEAAIDYVVIGGCAVGAYARLAGEAVFSDDLDLYLSEAALQDLLAWARSEQVPIEKLPQPRNVPVAVLNWHGLEVNALTASAGLPPADIALRSCREFLLGDRKTKIFVADPFDLLANKLAVARSKDQAHTVLLLRYLEAEVVASFKEPGDPRSRLTAARRYMAVRKLATLPEPLADVLIPLADQPALRRFLSTVVSGEDQFEQILAFVTGAAERMELRKIWAQRQLSQ